VKFEAFIKFDGGLAKIPGTVPKGARFGWIAASSYSFGATQTGSFQYGGGGATGKVQFQDFHFTYPTGAPDAAIFQACAAGTHFKEVILEVVKPGPPEQISFRVVFTDVLISSHTVSGQGSRDEKTMTSVSLNFKSMTSSYSQKTDKSAVLLQHDLDSALMA
jgi:type VI secretion system secreted protein Hcp